MRPWNLALALALGGCTYVTRTEYEAQLLERDEDADGVTVGAGDCDDAEATAYPGAEEIPYDGIDNDCAGDGDLVDVDGDGHAGLPAGGDDCRDTDPDVNPSEADEPYDGIDADCGADNDFDADGDGVIAAGVDPEVVGVYQHEWGTAFPEVYGDCDDLDDSVYPGAPGDVPYDGIDTDCDGADDFDADGDGVPSPADCLDQADAGLPGADPAQVYPGAIDAPYDGIDSDCAQDNDFDVDGDGWVRAGDEAAYAAYEAFYGYDLGAGEGDCNDTRSDVNPGAVEVLGNGRDVDCDGSDDTAPFGVGGLEWSTPRAPRWVATDDHLVLAVVADSLDDGVNSLPNLVSAMVFRGSPGPAEDPLQRLIPIGPDAAEALDGGLDLVADGSAFVVASVDARTANRTFSVLQRYAYDGVQYLPDPAQPLFFTGGSFAVASADLAIDTDEWLWSCGDGVLQATRGSDLATASLAVPVTTDTCFVGTDPSLGTACGPDGCRTATFDADVPSLTLAGAQPYASDTWTSAQRHGDLLVATDAEGAGAWIETASESVSVLPSRTIVHADAVEQGGEWFVAAVSDPGAGAPWELLLAWGPAGGPLSVATLGGFDATRPDLEPVEAAVEATAERIAVAATLVDPVSGIDAVAWSFYERQ